MAPNPRTKPAPRKASTRKQEVPRAPRERGRPPSSAGEQLSREAIITRTLQLAKTTPLQDLSIVKVARDIGVAPGLVHYYLGGRDALLSGVMNAFYRIVVSDWPTITGDWRGDLDVAGRRFYALHVQYGGIAAYVTAHNRFRMAQMIEAGEVDYGLLLFERFVGHVRQIGFDARRTAIYAQLLVLFLVTSAASATRRRWPDEHGDFLETVFARLDRAVYPNATFIRKEFASTTARAAFEAGWSLVLAGIDRERGLASGADPSRR